MGTKPDWNACQQQCKAGRPRDTEDVAKIILRQGQALDWDYVLQTARLLEEAVGQDLVSVLERLRRDD